MDIEKCPAKDQEMIINMEYGAFDNERRVLPLTTFDNRVDEISLVRPSFVTICFYSSVLNDVLSKMPFTLSVGWRIPSRTEADRSLKR